jgi:hypothetical protein
MDELKEAPAPEEAAWRSRPRRAAGGPVAGHQGSGGRAWCRGPVAGLGTRGLVAGCGRRPGIMSGKHQGGGGMRGR